MLSCYYYRNINRGKGGGLILEENLCLLWQDVSTRSWYHVGNLIKHDDDSFSFYYELKEKDKGLEEALAVGYQLHPAFPLMEKEYHSTKLFSAFARRLPSRNRRDYGFLFDLQKNLTNFELLELTGGSLYVDSYEFVKPVKENEGMFEIECFLRAWRHWNDESEMLLETTKLSLEMEPNNEYDRNAVCVINGETRKKIGYIPAFYSSFVTRVLKEEIPIHLEYHYFEEAAPQYKVKLILVGEIPQKLNYQIKNDSLLLY